MNDVASVAGLARPVAHTRLPPRVRPWLCLRNRHVGARDRPGPGTGPHCCPYPTRCRSAPPRTHTRPAALHRRRRRGSSRCRGAPKRVSGTSHRSPGGSLLHSHQRPSHPPTPPPPLPCAATSCCCTHAGGGIPLRQDRGAGGHEAGAAAERGGLSHRGGPHHGRPRHRQVRGGASCALHSLPVLRPAPGGARASPPVAPCADEPPAASTPL